MQAILLEDIEKLGKAGDVVRVKDGFARNFLFPAGKAVVMTKANMKLYEERKKRDTVKLAKEKEEAVKLVASLEKISCTIAAKVGEEDKLYGSVTAQDIERALAQEGFEIDRKKIEIEEPIRKLGVYSVNIRLHPEIIAPLKIWVVKE
ncbi:MAG: 50S ribosomal protein L9 [Candidatus Omnitrophica bacterium]|nr:50S ribosomal protein L9 [Candidatus Omnitrophota bacterium]